MTKAEYQRRWRQAHAEQRREYQRRHRAAHPEAMRARAAVNNRLYRGTLRRPDACEACGSVGPVDAHHSDYSRPLDVKWLCRSCHVMHDRERRRAS